jgi:hypothetical protein
MEYDELLPYYYNNNQTFLQQKLDPKIIRDSKIFEKTQIKWFSFDEIKKNRSKFRSFYRNVVDLILENKLEIAKFVRIKLRKKGKSKKMVKKTKLKTRKNK